VILDFDVIDSWQEELAEMNDGKRLINYHMTVQIPLSIYFWIYMRVYFHLPYRQTEEGVVRVHAGPKVA
jgi:hypothetical protein